jgi:DNA gyrase/topoisomerase IV subunit B
MPAKIKTIEEKFKKLDDISHVLLRPGRYLGSINPHTANTYTINEEEQFSPESITFIPALIKTFDEIITNSVDFSKTKDGNHLNTIKVDIDNFNGFPN